MKTVEFVQTCVNGDTPLLRHYQNARTREGGRKAKKLILDAGHFTRFDLYKDYCVSVEWLNYAGDKYIVVTHSQINHFFKVNS